MATTRRQSLPWPELLMAFALSITLAGYWLIMLYFGPWGRESPSFVPDALQLDLFATAATRLGPLGAFAGLSGFCLLAACAARLMKHRR
jgi:hypothetical protein